MIETDKFSRTGRRVIDLRNPRPPVATPPSAYPWGRSWPWGYVIGRRSGDPEAEEDPEELFDTLRVYNCTVYIDGKGLFDLGEFIDDTGTPPQRYARIDLSGIGVFGQRYLRMKVDWDRILSCPRPGSDSSLPEGFGLEAWSNLANGEVWGSTPAQTYMDISIWGKGGALITDFIHGTSYPQLWVPT